MSGIKRSIGAIVLGFEFIVIFLGSLVLYGLDAFASLGLPDWTALVIGGGVLLLTIVALATLRWRVGFALGWAIQVIVILGGFLQPLLFVVGAMFGSIWWYGLRAATRLESNGSTSSTP